MNRLLLSVKGCAPLFLILVIYSSQSFGQTTGDYESNIAAGNWNARANWLRYNGTTWLVPTAGQGYPGQNAGTGNVTILNGNVITLNVSPANAIASLQVGNTSDATTGTLTFNNARTLTVAGAVTAGNSVSGSSGTIDMTNNGTLSVNSLAVSGTGSTFTPGTGTGTVQFNATNLLPTSVFTSFNRIIFAGGTTTASTGLTINGNLTLSTGATFDDGGFTHTIAGNWVNNGGSFTSTGTIDFNNATAAQAINGTATSQAFNNLTVDKAGQTLTIGATTTTFAVGGALNVLNGTFTVAGITFSVTGSTSITGTLRLSNATNTKTFGGLITVNTGGTWNNSGNSPVTIQSGISNSGTFTAGTGLYTFDTNPQALTGTLSIANVTVNVITLTNNSTLTVATALSGSGTLTQGTTATLNIGNMSGITTLVATANGNTVNFTGAAQTINSNNYFNLTLSGSGVDVLKAGTTSIAGNMTISGSAKTTTVVDLVISGNLTTGNGTTFTAAGFALTVSGTTTIGSGASGSMVISSTTGAKIFTGLVRVNSGATWNNSGNSDVTIQGGITNGGGTFTSGTGLYTFDTHDQALNGTLAIRNMTVSAGINLTNNNTLTVATALSGLGTFIQAASAVLPGAILNIGGASTITALQATSANNTVNFTGTAQTINPNNYYYLTLSGSGIKTMNALTTSIAGDFTFSGTARATAVAGLTIGGNLILGTGTRFIAGAFTHTVGGNWTNNGTFTQNTSNITFSGGTAQIIGGSTATTFRDLTINNSNGVTLDDGTNSTNKIVTHTLTLSNGYLTTTSTNLLILNSGATASVANAVAGVPQANSPYVNGPMNKVGNQAFIFPVGALGTRCVPIGISAPGTNTDAFQAQYVRASALSLGTSITAPNLSNVSICEYWNLNLVTGTPTVNVTAYWNANNPCHGELPGGYVTDISTIALAHFDGSSWNSSTPIPAMTNGGTLIGSVTWLGVSTFSPFTLGNNSVSKDNPLNITLDYFTAVKANGYNKLTWKAECTTASNLFEAQRSLDGTHFTSIDTVKVETASDCSQAFVYNDYPSAGNKIYYRIKTTDIGGKVGYSEIRLISYGANTFEILSIKPNPVQSDASLSISSAQDDRVELVILSIDGRELQRKTVQVFAGVSTISVETNSLAKGMYILKGIFSGGQTNTIKFVKQ